MIWVLSALGLLFLVDILRMRGRLGKLGVLAATDEPVASDHQFVAAPGITLDERTRRAASAHARANGLDVLDLVPRDLPAIQAMSLAQIVDPPAYRADRLGPGRTAGHAILITADVAARAELTVEDAGQLGSMTRGLTVEDAGQLGSTTPGPAAPADEVEFVRLAARLKHFGKADVAVAPAERAGRVDLGRRIEVIRVLLGPGTVLALAVQPVIWALLALGVWLEPIAGPIVLGLWHAQPLLSIAGTPIRSRDLLVATLFRAPLEVYTFARTLFGRGAPADPVAARRADYERLVAEGTAQFFEARRETCPLCDSHELVVHIRSGDLFQHKPGVFTLERCTGCHHVFQNPRLSPAGLDFYYKDFYDGLGEAGMEFLFGFGAQPYHARAKMVREIAPGSRRWLDVGAGHGHFCAAARDDLPDTRFDGLDFGHSIDEAKRRGWIENAYRGLFPELAPELAGRYDAVSMSHYLEHTLDPRRELAAARTALAPDGHLMIEVPDPEFALGRLLRRYWLPWFQPQHLHLISVRNLERLLREHGFTPVAWHRGPAHQRVDFFFAAYLVLGRLAPPSRLPWRWRGAPARLWRALVWTVGAPLLLVGLIADNLAGPLFQRGRISNTYRVVARRTN